jgi:hypothetical protein
MAASRKPKDSRQSRLGQEKREVDRAWLGGVPSGGERLARLFRVGAAAQAAELEAKLARLRAKVDELELELSALRLNADGSDALPGVGSDVPLIELPRALPPAERDYRLSRCEGFAVYAGARLLGVVEGVRYHSSTDRPDVLEVRGGRLGRNLLLVPAKVIEAIEPQDETVAVNDAFYPPRARGRLHPRLGRLFRRR